MGRAGTRARRTIRPMSSLCNLRVEKHTKGVSRAVSGQIKNPCGVGSRMSRGCGGSERSFIPPGHRRAIRYPVSPDAGFSAALGAGNRRRGVGAHLVRDSREARVLEIPETESRAGGAGDVTPRMVRRRETRARESKSDRKCTTTSARLSVRVSCCGEAPGRVGPPESPFASPAAGEELPGNFLSINAEVDSSCPRRSAEMICLVSLFCISSRFWPSSQP